MTNITYIYLITNINNNPNKVYIGKTKNNRTRNYNHRVRFGKNIEYTVIDEINSLDRNYWEPLETYWIEQFTQWQFEVVNIRKKGGSGPEYQTDEVKRKISQLTMGVSRPKPKGFGDTMRKLLIGKSIHNDFTKSIIASANVKLIQQYDFNNNLIKEFKSAQEAGRCLNESGNSIADCAAGKQKSAYGYKWKYKE
jgi:hypothetical protein